MNRLTDESHREAIDRCLVDRSDHAHAIRKTHEMRRVPTVFYLPELCRQIYAETVTLSYALNIFEIDREDDVWVDAVLPAQLDAVVSAQPSKFFAVDMYSGEILSIHRKSPTISLRPKFPNLQQEYITRAARRTIRFRAPASSELELGSGPKQSRA
ncbi:hypothetical protein IQ06DRAFT_14538 [Phaeosphaeriaceae sp. SRC1lsM3a]|nr:hypothetical protein IQ06DRAFT_14538 [Stagonospora sp. SRC1lsM3a]